MHTTSHAHHLTCTRLSHHIYLSHYLTSRKCSSGWRTAVCVLLLLVSLTGCASFQGAVSATTPDERLAYAQMALDTARFIYIEWEARRGEAATADAAEREAKLRQQQAAIDFWTTQVQKLAPLVKKPVVPVAQGEKSQ